MSVTLITLTSPLTTAGMNARLQTASLDRYAQAEALKTLLQGLMGGTDAASVNIAVDGGAAGAKATGTLTVASGNASVDDTFTIGATTFTFKASASTSTQVTIGGTALITAQNAAAKVNALAALSGSVTATAAAGASSSGVVTFTCAQYGTLGNQLALAESGSNTTVSGVTLTGGVNPTANLLKFNV